MQKLVKREQAFEVVIVRSFSGGYCSSLTFGPRIFCSQPWLQGYQRRVEVCASLKNKHTRFTCQPWHTLNERYITTLIFLKSTFLCAHITLEEGEWLFEIFGIINLAKTETDVRCFDEIISSNCVCDFV